jgi:hypothetical protein
MYNITFTDLDIKICTGIWHPELAPVRKKTGKTKDLSPFLAQARSHSEWSFTHFVQSDGKGLQATVRSVTCPLLTLEANDWSTKPPKDDGSGNLLCGPCYGMRRSNTFVSAVYRADSAKREGTKESYAKTTKIATLSREQLVEKCKAQTASLHLVRNRGDSARRSLGRSKRMTEALDFAKTGQFNKMMIR